MTMQEMQLCGTGILNESQYRDPVAANRIHTRAHKIKTNPLDYDHVGVATALHSLVVDGQGILRTLKAGKHLDAKVNPMDAFAVKREVNILIEDLLGVAECIKQTLDTFEGMTRWPSSILIINGEVTSISNEIHSLMKVINGFQEQYDRFSQANTVSSLLRMINTYTNFKG
jgi:hypothetical protein